MQNSETYIINLKKDYGRFLISKNIINIFKCKNIEAYDCNEIDSNGYIIKWKDSNTYTQSAKKTKRDIFSNFMKYSKEDYIIIFEDDIYLHNNLMKHNNIIEQLNNFVKTKSPKLLYFGLSKCFKSDNTNTDKINFISFNEHFKDTIKLCSGAYGFMLRRDMIEHVIMRIDNPSFDQNPFDIFCLSYISYMYPMESFVTNPHLVVPNIEHSNIRRNFDQQILWSNLNTNYLNYDIPIIGIMYVNVIDELKFEYFNKMMMCITPIIKILYYSDNVTNNKEIHKSLEIVKNKNIYSTMPIICNIYTTNNISIKHFSGKKILDSIFNYKKYNILTILNLNNIELFRVKYLNNETTEITIMEDI